MDITVGPAGAGDEAAICCVLADNRRDPGLYQESTAAIARALGDFVVARDRVGRVVGCAGLHRDAPELAQVYAVAVALQRQGQGIGRRLVQACQERASADGIARLWLATAKPGYFARCGFQPMSRWRLPASVLLRKLSQTFRQPAGRWLPALLGRHTFMRCEVKGLK